MTWKALVEANPYVSGYPNQCLGQAQRVFGAPGTHYCARDAWDDAVYKHTNRELPDVPVPVWFENWLTIDGEYRDFGHVAVWFPDRQQFLNVPGKGYGQKWLNSIDEVNSWNGCDGYLGWSEDINGLKVAENIPSPSPIINTKETKMLICHTMDGRKPEQGPEYLIFGTDFYQGFGGEGKYFESQIGGQSMPVSRAFMDSVRAFIDAGRK